MSAGVLDLYIDQGADYSQEFQLLDANNQYVSLVGATVSGKINEPYDEGSVVATLTGTITDGDKGKFSISLTDTQTSAIPVDASPGGCARPLKCYLYDVVVTFASGLKERVLEGTAYVSPEVL